MNSLLVNVEENLNAHQFGTLLLKTNISLC